jgi:hypothetical protein
VAHLPRIRDYNLYLAGTLPDGNPIFGRYDPTIFANFVVESTGNSFYHALILQAEKRLLRYASINAHYTFSKAIDDVSDFDPDFAPHNQLDKRAGAAHSTSLRFVSVPCSNSSDRTGRSGAQITGGWTFSPIISANSFRPFNVLTGYDNMAMANRTHQPLGAGAISASVERFSARPEWPRKFSCAVPAGGTVIASFNL